MRDKNIDGLLRALAPAASEFFFTAPSGGRAAAPDDLVALARSVAPNVPAVAASSPMSALEAATAHGDPVVVAGSLYLAGEVRDNLWYPSTTPLPPVPDA
jgi:dihydrofolate synthase/folylpolyglutamate synthase